MSELEAKIKDRIKECMKESNSIELGILRIIIGEVQRSTKATITDEDVEKVLRKLREAASENLKLSDSNSAKFSREIEIYDSYLPKTLNLDEVFNALKDIEDEIKDAKSDGQATGLAMKYLKEKGCKILGKDVSETVRKIRN